MKSKFCKLLLALMFAASLLAVTDAAQAYWRHGYWHGGPVYYYGHGSGYYYHGPSYRHCGWVAGHWYRGIWYPGHRACW